MLQRFLLACGVASSVLYVGTDIAAAIRYQGYSYTSQAVSELMAGRQSSLVHADGLRTRTDPEATR